MRWALSGAPRRPWRLTLNSRDSTRFAHGAAEWPAPSQEPYCMKLTRLRLHGFKSFVDPTDFHIEPGLTGVVGPNGCGKSNLVEALRWVMGETSHKSLRAADMESVIFAGSGNR